MGRSSRTLIAARLPGVDLPALRERYHSSFERHYQAMLDGEIDFRQYRRQRLAEALEPWHDLDDELFAAYTEAKNQTIDGASLHPDALATLERLHAAGLRTGVLTNGPSEIQRRKLRATGSTRLVDAICISEELGVAKPDVRAFAPRRRGGGRRAGGRGHGRRLAAERRASAPWRPGSASWSGSRAATASCPPGARRADGLTAAADHVLAV